MPRPVVVLIGDTNSPIDCRAPIVTISIAAAISVTPHQARCGFPVMNGPRVRCRVQPARVRRHRPPASGVACRRTPSRRRPDFALPARPGSRHAGASRPLLSVAAAAFVHRRACSRRDLASVHRATSPARSRGPTRRDVVVRSICSRCARSATASAPSARAIATRAAYCVTVRPCGASAASYIPVNRRASPRTFEQVQDPRGGQRQISVHMHAYCQSMIASVQSGRAGATIAATMAHLDAGAIS